MTKREKVIVLAMVGALIYGGYNLLWAPEGQAPAKRPGAGADSELSALAVDVIGQLKQLDPAGNNARVIALARAPWSDNPFMQTSMYAQPPPDVQANVADAAALRFTGYLQMGDTRLAIIDGAEYEAGEILPNGYRVKSISPTRVVLQPAEVDAELKLPLETID